MLYHLYGGFLEWGYPKIIKVIKPCWYSSIESLALVIPDSKETHIWVCLKIAYPQSVGLSSSSPSGKKSGYTGIPHFLTHPYGSFQVMGVPLNHQFYFRIVHEIDHPSINNNKQSPKSPSIGPINHSQVVYEADDYRPPPDLQTPWILLKVGVS